MLSRSSCERVLRQWQQRLRLSDKLLRFEFGWTDGGKTLAQSDTTFGDDQNAFTIQISKKAQRLAGAEFDAVACHEMAHVLLWRLNELTILCKPYMPPEAMAVFEATLERHLEDIASKLEYVLTGKLKDGDE